MKTVLIAWELGGGLGHVMRAAALARECAARGATVAVALDDLANAHLAIWPEQVRLFQAPRLSRPLRGFHGQASYAELIYACGYHDGHLVQSLVRAWQALFSLVRPDVVVADYAPTAQLAARCAGIAQVRIGTGFFAPPPVSPLPAFLVKEGRPAAAARMLGAESKTLELFNAVRARASLPAAASLGEALQPDLDLIAGWPELDCYAALRPAGSVHYIGNERAGAGAPAAWPDAGAAAPKVFAYLKGDYAHCTALLGALGKSGYAVVAYVAGIGEALRKRYATGSMVLAAQPVDIGWATRTADAVVTHAGASAALFIEAGKPALLLPTQLEQATTAQMTVRQGAGKSMDARTAAVHVAAGLRELVENPAYRTAAQRLAARWRGKENPLADAAERILASRAPAAIRGRNS